MANNTSMLDCHLRHRWLESTRRLLGEKIDYDDILDQLDGVVPSRVTVSGSGNESNVAKVAADYSISRGWREELGINV